MQPKNTFFIKKSTLNCRGKLVDITTPMVMGILNLTPDSFYDGGRYNSPERILQKTEQMVKEGAALIDVGGMSSRPGSKTVSQEEELARVIEPIVLISKNFPEVLISIDTWRSDVADQALQAGAHIINDISGGMMDDKIYKVAANHRAPYIMMHMQGSPENMQQAPVYNDVTLDITDFFASRIETILHAGVKDIILDPGFGFGKTVQHNYELLSRLDYFKIFNLPVLAGVSRKSMVNKVLNVKPEQALNGSTALHTIALLNGANILRVHDVKEAMEAIKIVSYYCENKS